jgi:hypothetical protein
MKFIAKPRGLSHDALQLGMVNRQICRPFSIYEPAVIIGRLERQIVKTKITIKNVFPNDQRFPPSSFIKYKNYLQILVKL